MATLGNLMLQVGADLSSFNAAMGTMSDKLKAAEREAASSWSGFEALGSRMTAVGTTLSAAVTLPIIGIGAVSAKAFGEFESALNRVSALGEITGKDLDKLKAQAIDLGAKTQYSAKQAADGMGELAAAGFDATKIMAAMPAVLDLAASGQLSVGRAAEIASNLMAGFGIPAENVGKAVDVIAKAAAAGSLSVEDMGTTFKYIGPIASAAGLSFEEMAAATTLMSNAGIKGEQAGTGLRGAIASLLSPGKAAADAMERLGFTATDSTGKIRPFADIVEDLGRKGATTKDIFDLFGRETAPAMASLVNVGAPALRTMTAELQNSEGAAAKMAGTLNSGMGGAIERMKGSVETASIALGEVLAPHIITIAGLIESTANKLAEFGQWFNSLPAPIQNTSLAIVGVVAAIGPLLLIGGQMALAITSIHSALALATPLFATFTGTIGASVLAMAPWVAAIGVATVALYKLWEAFDGWQKAKADLDDAATRSQDALHKLENRLRENGFAVDELRKQYHQGEITLTRYQQGLHQMALELGKKVKVQKSATDATVKAKKAEADLAAALRLSTGATEKHADAVSELKRKDDVLWETARRLDEQHKAHVRTLVDLRMKMGDASKSTVALIPPTDDLNEAINAIIASTRQVAPAWIAALDTTNAKLTEALGPIRRVEDAYRQLGITSTESVKQSAEETRKAYETIKNSGTASARDLDAAWVKYEEARIDAAKAAGQAIPRETEAALAKVKDQLSGTKGTQAWSDWSKQVSTIITDLGKEITGVLWDGEMSWGEKGKSILKSIGDAFTRSFIEPATKALGDFVSGALADLMGGKGFGGLIDRVKDLGKTIADVFGVGSGIADATGAAGTSAAGGAGGGIPGTSGAGTTAAGAAGQGVMGAVNVVTGIVSAFADVVTAIYSIRQEGTLNAIEHNTRFAMMYLGEHGEGSIQQLLFRIADTLEFGTLVKALERSRDVLADYIPDATGLLSDLNTRFQFAVTRLDQIGNDVMYGSTEDRAQSGLLGQIRDSLATRTMQVSITVNGAASPQDTGNEIMRQLRAQGAF